MWCFAMLYHKITLRFCTSFVKQHAIQLDVGLVQLVTELQHLLNFIDWEHLLCGWSRSLFRFDHGIVLFSQGNEIIRVLMTHSVRRIQLTNVSVEPWSSSRSLAPYSRIGRLLRRCHRSLSPESYISLIRPNDDTPLKAFFEPTELRSHEVKLILVLAAESDFWDLNDGATPICSGGIIAIFRSLNCEIIFAGAFWWILLKYWDQMLQLWSFNRREIDNTTFPQVYWAVAF